MAVQFLSDAVLEDVVGGLSPLSNGVAAIDAFIDATGQVPNHRISNAMGAPAAGKELPFPPALLKAAEHYPN